MRFDPEALERWLEAARSGWRPLDTGAETLRRAARRASLVQGAQATGGRSASRCSRRHGRAARMARGTILARRADGVTTYSIKYRLATARRSRRPSAPRAGTPSAPSPPLRLSRPRRGAARKPGDVRGVCDSMAGRAPAPGRASHGHRLREYPPQSPRPLFGPRRLASIRPEHVRAYVAAKLDGVLQSGSSRTGRADGSSGGSRPRRSTTRSRCSGSCSATPAPTGSSRATLPPAATVAGRSSSRSRTGRGTTCAPTRCRSTSPPARSSGTRGR